MVFFSLNQHYNIIICVFWFELFLRWAMWPMGLLFCLLLNNHWANFNQTWYKASLSEGNSNMFKWILRVIKGDFSTCMCNGIVNREISGVMCFLFTQDIIFIPHTTTCGGYNVLYPSVSPFVSPGFFLSAQLLWNLSTNFVKIYSLNEEHNV